MIVKLGETKNLTIKEQTVDGILVNVYLKAELVNVPLVATDFLPQEVTAKVILRRDKANHVVAQDNLLVLGLFSALNYGINEWVTGSTLAAAAVATKAEKLISLYIPFGGPINVKEGDEMVMEMVVGRSTFGANADTGVSYIEFNPNYAIGYEYGTPSIKAEVIQANITKQKFSLGDNITKIALLNFDKTDITTQVVNTVQLSSDKLNLSLNFFDVYNRHRSVLLPPRMNYTEVTADVEYPQSFIIHASPISEQKELDNCTVDVSTNSAQVAASQNYLVWHAMDVSKTLLMRAEQRRAKHAGEKLDTIPA